MWYSYKEKFSVFGTCHPNHLPGVVLGSKNYKYPPLIPNLGCLDSAVHPMQLFTWHYELLCSIWEIKCKCKNGSHVVSHFMLMCTGGNIFTGQHGDMQEEESADSLATVCDADLKMSQADNDLDPETTSLEREQTSTSNKTYSCSICGKVFTSASYRAQHVRRHLGIKRYQCSKCLKEFYELKELKLHSRVHSNKKPYKCSWCGK